MTTSTAPLRVVMIGLPHTHPSIPAEQQPGVGKGLAEVPTLFADLGIHYEFDEVTPEAGLAALGPKLHSQHPDAIVIGNGIRSNPKFTYFFEQILDVVRAGAPEAKLLFNTSPEGAVDAVKRWFPSVK